MIATKTQPHAFGYILSRDEVESVHAQERAITEYHHSYLAPEGIQLDSCIADRLKPTSERSVFHRPAMKRLKILLQPGDHLVVACIDRLVDRASDWPKVERWAEDQDIALHIVDPPVVGHPLDSRHPFHRVIIGAFGVGGAYSRPIATGRQEPMTASDGPSDAVTTEVVGRFGERQS